MTVALLSVSAICQFAIAFMCITGLVETVHRQVEPQAESKNRPRTASGLPSVSIMLVQAAFLNIGIFLLVAPSFIQGRAEKAPVFIAGFSFLALLISIIFSSFSFVRRSRFVALQFVVALTGLICLLTAYYLKVG